MCTRKEIIKNIKNVGGTMRGKGKNLEEGMWSEELASEGG